MSRDQINLQSKTNSLLNWFLHKKSKCINQEPFFVKSTICNSISASYRCLNESSLDTHEFRCTIKEIDLKRYETPYLSPVIEISKFIKKSANSHIKHFILHGSLSTLDYIPGWSDFDSIAVISDRVLNNPIEMIKLRSHCSSIEEMIQKIDKHQHHGIHFIAEKDLLMYSDTYLPTALFKDSVSLLENIDFSCQKRDSRQEQIDRFNSIYQTFKDAYDGGTLRHHAYNGIYMMDNFRNYQNSMYQMKYFLSVVCLLPSYFMNISGEYLTKPESIEACRKFISKENFEIVDISSKARSSWKINPAMSNEIPADTIKIIGENYFFRGYNFIREMKSALGV